MLSPCEFLTAVPTIPLVEIKVSSGVGARDVDVGGEVCGDGAATGGSEEGSAGTGGAVSAVGGESSGLSSVFSGWANATTANNMKPVVNRGSPDLRCIIASSFRDQMR